MAPPFLSRSPYDFKSVRFQGRLLNFEFQTDSGAIYNAYFEDFTDIGSPDIVWLLNLARIKRGKSNTLPLIDHRIGATLMEVFRVLLQEYPHVVVMYLCSREKNRQQARFNLFNEWIDGCTWLTRVDISNKIAGQYGGLVYSINSPRALQKAKAIKSRFKN